MRPIDADALKKRVKESTAIRSVKVLAATLVSTAPTIDAAPVVRCKDCKYAYYYNEEGCHGFVCNGYFQYADVEPNDFCSYGAMRNNYE